MTEHSHAPDPGKRDVLKLRASLKRQATETLDQPCQIIQRNLADVPVASTSAIPNKSALRQIIGRTRRSMITQEPKTLEEIEIPDNLTEVDGERFVGRDVKVGNERILLFATKTNLKLLEDSELWIMDGTFITCPVLFCQLYTIHGFIGEGANRRTMPLAYGLLTSKTEECYVNFFRALKEYACDYDITLCPQIIITDFEIAAINAVRIEFPEVLQKGCLFHLGQNLWRKIQRSGLSNLYGTDADFALKLRHLTALAFLPAEDVPEAFQLLKDQLMPEAAAEVFEWFEYYYVLGKIDSRVTSSNKVMITRTPPMFPPALWSICTNNELDLPRTQNNVEAWHRRWNTLLNKKKHGVYMTISFMLKEQKTINHCIQRSQALIERTPSRKKGKRNENKITQILSQRRNMETVEFLRAIAIHTKL